MSAFATPRRPARPYVSLLMAFEACSLAVFAALHLSGALRIGDSASGGPSSGAGAAEGVICLALVGGAGALVGAPRAVGLRVARFAVGFAIVGFIIGLTFTVDSGDPIDLAYHLVMLPVLVASAVLLTRSTPRSRRRLDA